MPQSAQPSSTHWWIPARPSAKILANGWKTSCLGYQATKTTVRSSATTCPKGRRNPTSSDLAQLASTWSNLSKLAQVGKTCNYLYKSSLSGRLRIDLYDIMKVTDHSSPAMLKKYIKADSLEIVEKLTDKYDYFR